MATISKVKNKKGTSYKITVSCGLDINGRQVRKHLTWSPDAGMTQKQIEKKLNEVMVEFEKKAKQGLILDGNTRFADYAKKWLSINENNLSPSTHIRYNTILERIIPAIGHIKLENMQAHHLQEFYNNLAEYGINKRTGGGLSNKTILHHHRFISVVMGEAYRQGYIVRDVSTLVKPPKVTDKEISYLDEHDALKVINALQTAPIKWKTSVLVLLYTGMRRGELLGLEWNDVDFDNNVIHIKRNVQYVVGDKYKHIDKNGIERKGKVIEKDPKTKSSNRFLKVDNGVMYLLSGYKKWWVKQKLSCGDMWVKTNKIFIRDDGDVMHPDSITDWISKFIKTNDLPHFSPHSLRHTNISIMIANGVDIKTVSSRAGHNNITTTGNIYTHQIQSANARAAEIIGDLFGGIKENAKHA